MRRLLPLLCLLALPGSLRAAEPLPPGHYGGPATVTWSVSSSPSWLRDVALAAIELREGIDDLPANGSCRGVVGLDVAESITGAARCEFAGDLARYNDRVASLTASPTSSGLRGTATCCGSDQVVGWTASRSGDALSGSASGSSSATAVSVSTPLGSVEVSLTVSWSVRFEATRANP